MKKCLKKFAEVQCLFNPYNDFSHLYSTPMVLLNPKHQPDYYLGYFQLLTVKTLQTNKRTNKKTAWEICCMYRYGLWIKIRYGLRWRRRWGFLLLSSCNDQCSCCEGRWRAGSSRAGLCSPVQVTQLWSAGYLGRANDTKIISKIYYIGLQGGAYLLISDE